MDAWRIYGKIKKFCINRSWLLAIGLFCLMVLQAGTSIRGKSVTFDESLYIGQGRYILETGNFNLVHSPLCFYINSILLLFLDFDDSFWQPGYIYQDYRPNVGNKLLYESKYKASSILFLSRVPFISLAVLLALFVFKWAKELYGTKAGLFALLFYSFSPNVLAHSRLATTDITITCFIFIAIYYFRKFLKTPTMKSLSVAGFTFGLALLSKLTALLLLPVYLILCIFFFGTQKEFCIPFRIPSKFIKNSELKNIYHYSLSLFLIIIIGFFVLWVGYGFEFGSLSDVMSKKETSKAVAVKTPFFEKMPLPIPSYFKTMLIQSSIARLGHSAFLMGQCSTQGWWYYYLFAFFIKTPIPTLLLLILAIIMLKKYSHQQLEEEVFLLILPVVILIVSSFFTRSNLGLRYILPMYPFLFVFIGKVVDLKILKLKILKVGLVFLLCLWYIFSTLSIYPHYLAYFNELVGGPNNGHKYLVDSNLDWGQDLPGLQEYLAKNKNNSISLHYFGTADPKYYGFSDVTPVPYGFISGRINKSTKGVIAISATALQGVYDRYGYHHRYDWLKDNYKPITKIGYSIFVYNIPESKNHSNQNNRAGNCK